MPTYDYICETCGHEGRAWRTEEQGPSRFCSRKCRYRSKSPIRRVKPNKWVITPDMHNAIRAVYQGDTGNGQIRDLARRLGLPRWKVTRHAVDQGWIAKQKKEPDWKERELKILERNAHLTPQAIQRKLKKYGYERGQIGIVLKRRRMRFLQNLPGHSATSVAECFGLDTHWVSRQIKNGLLKAKKRGTDRTAAQGGDSWYIKDKDIREFIVNNVEVVDFRKIDKYWLVDILAGGGRGMNIAKEKREKRSIAALHCVHYRECLDKAAKGNNRLECHKCDKLKFVTDNYQKDIGAHSINYYNEGEQTIRIDCAPNTWGSL